jgi:RTX calcium-binding nonapeptide repeat (4 copies)
MRRLLPVALIAVLAALVAAVPSLGQAAPGASFRLDVPTPCVAEACSVVLSYDTAQATGPVALEIDWDHPGPPEAGFVARSRIECAPVPPGQDPSFAEPCTDSSPPYATAGAHQVVLRVTDVGSGASSLSAQTVTVGEKPKDYCEPRRAGEQCGPGNGRKTPGGGGKVSHKGWPRITGVLWSVQEGGRGAHSHTGGPLNDELLGHHGSDTIDGAEGHDVIWGDWDPNNNNSSQRDKLNGGPGNDWIYPSHGNSRVKGGAGNDYVYAFYGRGTIDCGPGKHDKARVRLVNKYKVRNCETILHFCAFGSDGHGGCLKPGEHKAVRSRRD